MTVVANDLCTMIKSSLGKLSGVVVPELTADQRYANPHEGEKGSYFLEFNTTPTKSFGFIEKPAKDLAAVVEELNKKNGRIGEPKQIRGNSAVYEARGGTVTLTYNKK